MKSVVLLALVGLVSCHTAFIGGDRSSDVKIEYKFDDDYGREVEVEVNDDHRFDLGSFGQTSRPSFKRIQSYVAPRPVTTQFVRFEERPEVRTQYVQRVPVVAPRPTHRTQLVQVAAPTPVVTRYIRREPELKTVVVPVVPDPRPQVVTQYFRSEPVAVSRPVVARTSFVNAVNPVPVTFQTTQQATSVHVTHPRPSFRTSFESSRNHFFRASSDDSSEK